MRELERDTPTTSTPSAPAPIGALSIVGRGRAGSAIARAARDAGIPTELLGRDALPGDGAGAVLLCVPDGAIADACAALAGRVGDGVPIGHVSGASTLSVLGAAARAGHPVFSMHPLQTIPDEDSELAGAHCAVAGSDAEAEGVARGLAGALGMHPFAVAEGRRAAYHAAAAIASNFLVALEESAASLLSEAGVAEPRAALAPLVERSAENWARRGAEALTGPIARGDEATVAAHREAIAEHAPELAGLYEAMAARTREIAR